MKGPASRPQTSEPDQSIRAVTRALANVDSVQREMRRDLNQLKDTVAEREDDFLVDVLDALAYE